MKIDVYDADGRNAGARSLASVNRLIESGLYAPERNRKGIIVAIHRRGSIRSTAHMGQSYVIREALADGHFAYKHKPLARATRDIFLAVPLSCLVPVGAPAGLPAGLPARA